MCSTLMHIVLSFVQPFVGRILVLIASGNEYNTQVRPTIRWTNENINILRSLASHL